MEVGTKELKNRLSHYLHRVRSSGDSVFVTDRGKIVAEVRSVPPARDGDDVALRKMEAEELMTRGRGRIEDVPPAPRRRGGKLLSAIVLEDRR